MASLLSPPVALQGSNWSLSVRVRVVINTFRVIFTAVQKPHLAHIPWQQLVSCPIRTKEINPTDASHTLINVSLSSFEKFRQRNKAVSQLSKPALRTFLWRPLSKMFIYSKPSLLAWLVLSLGISRASATIHTENYSFFCFFPPPPPPPDLSLSLQVMPALSLSLLMPAFSLSFSPSPPPSSFLMPALSQSLL